MAFGKGVHIFDKIKNGESSSSSSDSRRSSGIQKIAPSIKLPKFKRNTDNLSQGMDKIQFGVDELQSYGEAGRVKALAYDPVQSLMAVATEFNHVCIFGQARVTYTLELQTVNPIKALRFVKGIYLLVFDSVDTIFVISLFTKTVLRKITTSVEITAFDTDYSLEFVFVGLKNGMVKAFDIETGKQTFLNIVEERRSSFPLVADKHVCSLKLHPRDIGTLLISYPKETMIYSLADDKVMLSFIYTLERTAPGGENATYAYGADGIYLPDVTHSLWHPNGLHIVTVHDDNSIVFWDAKTGERILARTLFDSYVDAPTGKECKRDRERMSSISTIRWLCDSDPEKSMLLIMGGDSYADEGCHQLVRMNFGKMISYSMSTYQHMADYYSQPKQQNIFAIHSNANVSDFVPLPEKSPYFDGNQKPALVALIMSDGSLKFMNYPEGSLSFDARRFPSTVSWLNPKITCSSSSYLDTRILSSIYEAFPPNVSILKGGIPSKPKYRVVAGSVVITGHESGFIRVWNSSEGALDSSSVLEIDIGGILQNDECSVSSISFAPEQTELSCSLVNGDVLLFSYQSNKLYQPQAVAGLTNKMSSLSIRGNAVVDISDRAPLNLKKGFMPKLLVRALDNGRVTALCNSSVNFVAVGYESGRLLVIDRRGGVVIHNEILQDAGLSIKITPTAIQFGFGITGTQQQRCSILMYVGTSIGRLITYQLLADARGRFTVNRIEDIDSNDSDIVDILAVNSVTGRPCSPTLGQLRSQPLETDLAFPLVISASTSDLRVIKNNAKIAHKTYGKGDISKVGVTGARTVDGNISFCLVCINGRSKKIAALSLPSLSQLSELRIPYRVEAKYAQQSSVLPLGDIFLRITETEAALVNIMNLRQAIRGPETSNSADVLFLKNIMVPWRPTFNQMVKNTAGITYSQLYKLLLGRDRPEKGSTEEYTKAWNISPYNPANYSLLGAGKPKYYDPNALHQHIDVGKSPKSAHSFENNGRQVSKLKKYASDAIEHSANKVEAYVSDVNDNFDQAVKDARKEALRSIVKSGF